MTHLAKLFTNSLTSSSLVAVFSLLSFASEIKAATQLQAPSSSNTQTDSQSKGKTSFSGNVSWYGPQFQGKKTASGEIFDMNKLTSAHLKLPFGTRVLVEDPRTGKTVIVKVNDRGPYVRSRVMDLSREGGRRVGLLSRGVAYVTCLVLN